MMMLLGYSIQTTLILVATAILMVHHPGSTVLALTIFEHHQPHLEYDHDADHRSALLSFLSGGLQCNRFRDNLHDCRHEGDYPAPVCDHGEGTCAITTRGNVICAKAITDLPCDRYRDCPDDFPICTRSDCAQGTLGKRGWCASRKDTVESPLPPPVEGPVKEPVEKPVEVPVTPPVTTPVTPPVTPPATAPVTPPVTPPATPPVTRPATSPVSEPTSDPTKAPSRDEDDDDGKGKSKSKSRELGRSLVNSWWLGY